MRSLVRSILKYRALALIALGCWLVLGVWTLVHLDIEAYPDPSPPLVEVITQNPSWSSEEMEQQITVPIETELNGIPHIEYIRSISIFGLSDIKLYFNFDSDYWADRQEVLNRLQLVTLPPGIQAQLSPESPIGEIYRFRVDGKGYSLNDLKATADWQIHREVKQVPGIIDVTIFGGTTRQYQAEVDPQKLLQYNVSLQQVVNAVQSSNSNVGGSYLTLGSQAVNVRGIGLLHTVEQMNNIVIAEHSGAPVFLKDVADVHEGYQQRLGKVGANGDADIVEGIVLLQKGEQSLPALQKLHEKIKQLNNGLLPPGMHIRTLYDRTDLIKLTTATVRHLIFVGLVLVLLLLMVFLGDLKTAVITALTIPFAVLFAFGMMVLTGHSANLISIGAIDFGIIVDSAVVVCEHIYRALQNRQPETTTFDTIAQATAQSARPVMFSTLVILVAFLPLFTMEGVPGKIFEPMSITYGFALTGALLFGLLFAPVLATWRADRVQSEEKEVRLVRGLRRVYTRTLEWTLGHRGKVVIVGAALLLVAGILLPLMGGEFMPKLEEGNLWVRATLPPDISFEYASKLADNIRDDLRSFPEVTQVVSQLGRPDDGTDVVSFNNLEFGVQLKHPSQWPHGIDKEELVRQMDKALEKYPHVDFNFSQNIQDNVEEAMSGVKGENSLKLFGDDLEQLTATAEQIKDVMEKVPGVDDLGVFKVMGQPNLLISIDRTVAARYGLMASDVNSAVQAAIGGITATQILDGDRRYDFLIRYKPEFREDPDVIKNILLPTPDGNRIPLGQVANVQLRDGAFMIYRENNRRYIPIKFSVRGRDLSSTMQDLQDRIAKQVKLPTGFHYEWAGEYDSLKKEQQRLMVIIPITLAITILLLYLAFDSLRDALIIIGILPFGAVGGVLGLFLTGTPFSVSAAVGFASALGVGTLGALVFLSAIRRSQKRGASVHHAIRHGALEEMRPVMMACLAAGLGLLPAAVSHGIGAQAQQPLARVVVGAMVTTTLAILFVIPVLVSYFPGKPESAEAISDEHERELQSV